MEITEEIFSVLKRDNISVSDFSSVVGIPTPRIYKWKSGTKPKYEDESKLRAWLKKYKETNGSLDNMILKEPEHRIITLADIKDELITSKEETISALKKTIEFLENRLVEMQTEKKRG